MVQAIINGEAYYANDVINQDIKTELFDIYGNKLTICKRGRNYYFKRHKPKCKIINKDVKNDNDARLEKKSITVDELVNNISDLTLYEGEISIDMLIGMVKDHELTVRKYIYYNSKLRGKSIRKPNYPSEITENIVKYAVYKKYGFVYTWNTKPGDLKYKDEDKNIEVKGGYLDNGPSSYGPKEHWDWIYYVDCSTENYKVYELRKSNEDFMTISINKKETYHDKCKKGQRPRFKFN